MVLDDRYHSRLVGFSAQTDRAVVHTSAEMIDELIRALLASAPAHSPQAPLTLNDRIDAAHGLRLIAEWRRQDLRRLHDIAVQFEGAPNSAKFGSPGIRQTIAMLEAFPRTSPPVPASDFSPRDQFTANVSMHVHWLSQRVDGTITEDPEQSALEAPSVPPTETHVRPHGTERAPRLPNQLTRPGNFLLQLKAVYIECLDRNGAVIGKGSGCIVVEAGGAFLYTCWHVATGITLWPLQFVEPPKRRTLRVHMQNVTQELPAFRQIGGRRTFDLQLYESDEPNARPMWYQDAKDVPNPDLNSIGLRVPFWHDAIKLPLPSEVVPSPLQQLEGSELERSEVLVPGDRVYLVGFPHGYSAMGDEQPTPVVITRNVAAFQLSNRRREVLLDGPGARGMSGGPVFWDLGTALQFVGVYTGIVYPDVGAQHHDTSAFLGTFCDLAFVRTPGLDFQRHA